MSETQPGVDFLILADRVEAINGKLYMMGGAWDVLTVAGPGAVMQFGCALGVLVPWLGTNIDHHCILRLEDADGATLFEMTVNFRCGRPPHLQEGATQRVLMAFPLSVSFPRGGAYALIAEAGGEEKRTRFEVRMPPAAAAI